jgi:restriction system protein
VDNLIKPALRVASILFNCIRLRHLPGHLRRLRAARRALRTIQAIRGAAAEARLFAYLRKIDPLVFEELVLCAIERTGAFVVRNRRYAGDGGIDGRAWISGMGWCAIQVKRYRTGFFVHTGRTGAAAWTQLGNERIILLSGQRLVALMIDGRLPSPPICKDASRRQRP